MKIEGVKIFWKIMLRVCLIAGIIALFLFEWNFTNFREGL